jgi:hypothetical protein
LEIFQNISETENADHNQRLILICPGRSGNVAGSLLSGLRQEGTLNLPEHSSATALFLGKMSSHFTSTSCLHFRKELITTVHTRAASGALRMTVERIS